jgi:hypothetical protein
MAILEEARLEPGGQASIDQLAAELRTLLDQVGVERNPQFAEAWGVAGRFGGRMLVEAGVDRELAARWLLAFWSVGLSAQEPG